MGILTDWGSTPEERAKSYPCDLHLRDATATLYRAVNVEAPAPLVFRWLCQLRMAPYSYDWLDNGGRQSPHTRDPANEQLMIGQEIMGIFRLVEFERDRHLTLVTKRTSLYGDVAVTYLVTARADHGTRLLVKVSSRPRLQLLHVLLSVGDFIMMRRQLLTLKSLAEREAQRGDG